MEKEIMKRLIFVLTICMALVACDIETSGNGDLDGFWQLRQVDTLATEGTKDMRQSMIYWAVQNRLIEVRLLENEESNGTGYLFHFDRTDDQLNLSVPYLHLRDEPDEEVIDLEVMRPFGFDALQQSFAIKCLDNDKMILETQYLRLHFRKY